MKGVDAIARILKKEGVDFIGCIPYNTLEEAAAKAGVRPMLFRQERVGINTADGFSRVTNGRRIGVFTMQAGPGAENGFPGVAQAYSDSTPILLLPAGANRDRSGVRPTFSPARSYRDVTKWADTINMPNRIPEMMRRAFSQLRTGRPSPVLLEMPTDVMGANVDDALIDAYRPVAPYRTSGDPQDVKEAAAALLKARRPVIHAGQGVLYSEAWDELRELAELLQAPVMTTLGAKGVFPEDHPLALGAGGASTTGPVMHFLQHADLVFGIGCSFTRTHFGVDIPSGKTIVHCTNDESDINKDYDADYAVLGDAKLVLRQVIDEVKAMAGSDVPREAPEVAREVKAVKDAWLGEWMPKLTSDETPINPYRVIWEMMRTLDRRKAIVTHDSGSPRDHMSPFFETLTPRGFLGWGKSTQLGYSLGLALGAKLADPDKLCINVLGDFAFGMVGLDIETAVRERIPILTIVLNNSGMGIYQPERFAVSHKLYNIKRLTGRYDMVAQAMGSWNERVEKPEDIAPALRRAQKVTEAGQPALLEIITREEHSFSLKDR